MQQNNKLPLGKIVQSKRQGVWELYYEEDLVLVIKICIPVTLTTELGIVRAAYKGFLQKMNLEVRGVEHEFLA